MASGRAPSSENRLLVRVVVADEVAAVGGFMVWWALRTPIGQYTGDYDGNGIVDAVIRYAGPVLTQMEFDRNEDGDGDVDKRCRFRSGVLAECQFHDAAGRVIKLERYKAGVLSKSELDTNADGTFDLVRDEDWMGEAIAP